MATSRATFLRLCQVIVVLGWGEFLGWFHIQYSSSESFSGSERGDGGLRPCTCLSTPWPHVQVRLSWDFIWQDMKLGMRPFFTFAICCAFDMKSEHLQPATSQPARSFPNTSKPMSARASTRYFWGFAKQLRTSYNQE